MATAIDVASYILAQKGSMTTMKLQKLVYYSQAWSLVWDEKPLFRNRIEAWANGPVCPTLYQAHKGHFKIGRISLGNARNLTAEEKDTTEAVLRYYGAKSSQWLSALTHSEPPWKNARKGLSPRTRGTREITYEAMGMYYGGL